MDGHLPTWAPEWAEIAWSRLLCATLGHRDFLPGSCSRAACRGVIH